MRQTFVMAAIAALFLPLGARAAPPPVRVTTTIAPGPHLFGDRVEVELGAIVDSKRVDPDKVRIDTSFEPYERVGGARRGRERQDDDVRLVYRYTLSCLSGACVQKVGKAQRTIEFPAATVRYRSRRGGRQAVSAPWPSFRLVARFVPQTVIGSAGEIRARLQFQNDPIIRLFAPTKPPEPTYRLSPELFGALLLAATLAALAGGGLVARPLLNELLARRARRETVGVTPLERALELVERSSRRSAGTPRHREALARLARELRQTGRRDLVAPARQLAWSEEAPTAADSEALTRRVREVLGGMT